MSTRATIKIIKKGRKPVWMYHHCDGYPDGVGVDLLDLLSYYDNKKWLPNDLSDYINQNDYDYEFTEGQHGDEDYGYLIDCDKHTLKCYSLGWDQSEWDDEDIEKIPGQNDDFVVDKIVKVRISLKNWNDPEKSSFSREIDVTESEYEYLKSCMAFERSHTTDTMLSVSKL